MAEFDGGLERILRAPGTAFTLVCKDVSGNAYSGNLVQTGENKELKYLPGIRGKYAPQPGT